MERPRHEMAGMRDGQMTPKRMVSIGLVGALHIVIIWALFTGLAKTIVTKYVAPDLQTKIFNSQPVKPMLAPQPVQMARPQPSTPTVVEPVFDIQTPLSPTTIQAPPTQITAPPDTSASGVSSTHTTPPYPADSRRLGQQGTVVLALNVSAQGTVMDAKVVTSSGTPELDQTAVSWVTAHWKYKPALQNGVAVPSTTQAAVKFDLKQAH